jgi:hypothetical protein
MRLPVQNKHGINVDVEAASSTLVFNKIVYVPNNTYLTDICSGLRCDTISVGGNRRPDINFRTRAI